MESYSISFTLGKASSDHGGNIEHNNRDYYAKNVDSEREIDNIQYKSQDIEEAYHELFDTAVEEHNQKQSRPCRRIENYYEHIKNSRREELFYEAIIQFGNVHNTPCNSKRGDVAKKMLADYMNDFQKRNPNLYVFNAVMHLDEASPHLHIDFIPYYTKGRTNGLSKGVSMKAALNEQGFKGDNKRNNHLIAWERSERKALEAIINTYNFEREDMNAKYKHLPVEEFKIREDEKKIRDALKQNHFISSEKTTQERVRDLTLKLESTTNALSALKEEKSSPMSSFFYSDSEKQSFVQSKMDASKIQYVDAETGFYAQKCYAEQIRKWEKMFKPSSRSFREKLQGDIDKLLMQCNDVNQLYKKLEKEGYTIKLGKYISVKHPQAERFIRLKTLGEEYNERALQNRIQYNIKFENELNAILNEAKANDSPNIKVLTAIRFYTVSFKKGLLPCHKKHQQQPFSWSNDAELDKLLTLNKKINEGTTIQSMKEEFEITEKELQEKYAELDEAKTKAQRILEGKEAFEVIYENKNSDLISKERAALFQERYPNINANNYHMTKILAEEATESLEAIKNEVAELEKKVRNLSGAVSIAEQVRAGTYIQELVSNESIRRAADKIPNGLFKL